MLISPFIILSKETPSFALQCTYKRGDDDDDDDLLNEHVDSGGFQRPADAFPRGQHRVLLTGVEG